MRAAPMPLLLVGCVALTAVLAWQWFDDDHRWQPDSVHPVDPALFDLHSLTHSPASAPALDPGPIGARPLFVPGRKPLPGAGADQHRHDEASNIALIGVFQTERTAGALLLIDGEVRRLSLGASASGLTLQEILEDAVVLVDRNGQETEYRIRRKAQAATPAEPIPEMGSPPAAPDDEAFDD